MCLHPGFGSYSSRNWFAERLHVCLHCDRGNLNWAVLLRSTLHEVAVAKLLLRENLVPGVMDHLAFLSPQNLMTNQMLYLQSCFSTDYGQLFLLLS